MTFRLADSLPAKVIESLRLADDLLQSFDRELDSGSGACWLLQPEIASLVENALIHFDRERYRLLAWCLMPNHVHVVVEVSAKHSLTQVIGNWKSFTAKRANSLLGRSGPFWHADYFDRYMRDENHLMRTIAYVEDNPVKAGLVMSAPEWPWSSARFARS